MTQACVASLKAERIRVAQLTSTGAPNTSTGLGYVSDAQIKVDVNVEVEAGDEFTQKNGAGTICAYFTDVDKLKQVALSVDLCKLDYELFAILTGFDTFVDSSDSNAVIGMQAKSVDDETEYRTCFEVWTRAWDGSVQATPTVLGGSGGYHHWVFPNVQWVPGSTSLDNGIHVFPVTGVGVENANITADGPFNDWPADIVDQAGVVRTYGSFFDSALPAAACGSTSLSAS